jgi:hypothetical protein
MSDPAAAGPRGSGRALREQLRYNAFSFIPVPSPFSNLAPLLQSQPNASKVGT